MKVKELMTKKVFTVTPEDKVDKVFILFNFEAIRHIPVVEGGEVAGILSDRDLKKILGPQKQKVVTKDGTTVMIQARKVRTLMKRNVTTIGPDERASDAAAIMAKRKIGCLPVVKNKKLVGIITSTDILRAFVKLSNDIMKIQGDGKK